MPDVTGAEVYERLRTHAPAVLERIVFMTGGAFTDEAREFIANVPNPCLEKPFEMDEIRALLARMSAVT